MREGLHDRPGRRTGTLKALAGTALLLVFAVGVGAIALDVLGRDRALTPPGWSGASVPAPPATTPLAGSDTPLGRLRAGDPRPEDLLAVVAEEDTVGVYLPEADGTRTLVGAYEFTPYGYWEELLSADRPLYGWTQVRDWAGFGTVVEEALLLEDPAATFTVWEGWRGRALADGLVENDGGLSDRKLFTVSFTDDGDGEVRCVTQTITHVGTVLFAVTLLQPGDCAPDAARLVASYAYALRTNAGLLVGW